ncbi:DUF5666 domain-containing protein [Brevibacillus dissolubilis]|uniref:DUF5666 domain-containing protein n=1 Tax=Brevibacillus dissolubilis TaxID=1844116 RepID=UPI0011175B37|nr:DUF5666 domain-containing protein [Brevibacillus dissolubilis]
MKKWLSLLLVCSLMFSMVSIASAKTQGHAQKTTQVAEKAKPPKKVKATGTISNVDVEENMIEIDVRGTTVSMGVYAQTKIQVTKLKKPTLADIYPGETAKVEYTQDGDNNKATSIMVVRTSQPVKGTVEEIDTAKKTLKVGGKTVKTTSTTKVHYDDENITFEEIKQGDKVVVVGTNSGSSFTARVINIVEREGEDGDTGEETPLKAVITSIDAEAKTITLGEHIVKVVEETTITQGEKTLTFEDLKENMSVEVAYKKVEEELVAVSIKVATETEPPQTTELKGKVESVDATAKTFVVTGKTVKVTETTVIKGEEDKTVAFDAITVDATVTAIGTIENEVLVATSVKVEGAVTPPPGDGGTQEGELAGDITAINLTANTLTIGGKTVSITDKTEIKGEKDKKLKLKDVKQGMKAEAKGKWKNGVLVAEKIKVTGKGKGK